MIPAGTELMLHVVTLHKDERWFPDPDRFDPDRFLPEATSRRHPYAYVPFSAGSRNCIGQKFAQNEMKVLVSTILRKYSITTDVSREEHDSNLRPELVLRPGNGVQVNMRRCFLPCRTHNVFSSS